MRLPAPPPLPFNGRSFAARPLGQVLEASAERPHLSLRLDLDPALVGSVMVEAGHLSSRSQSDVRAIDVSPLDANLLDAVVRLVRLLDSPAEARILRPLITREIVYRLLMGDQGNRLRHLALLAGTPTASRKPSGGSAGNSPSHCGSTVWRGRWG